MRGQELDTRGGGKLLDMNGKGLTKRYKIFFKTGVGFHYINGCKIFAMFRSFKLNAHIAHIHRTYVYSGILCIYIYLHVGYMYKFTYIYMRSIH